MSGRTKRIIAAPKGVAAAEWAKLTRFQREVLRAVCTIPAGQTRTYQWIARKIGRPRAPRAVGNALKRNPFAPWVPCHRVVKTGGGLGGYSGIGGLSRKAELLRNEGWNPSCGLEHRTKGVC